MLGKRVASWAELFDTPGGYMLSDVTDKDVQTKPRWYCNTPNGHLGNLGLHEVTEHEDGTITVSPSILVSTSRDGQKVEVWHGFLEHGVWREV